MTINFAGEPPRATVTQAAPTNRAPGSAQISGGGNTLTINADGSINTVAELPPSTGLTSIVVNAVVNGDNTLLAGSTGTTIKVYRMLLDSTGSVTVTVKSGAGTALSGAMPLSTASPLVLNFSPYPWFASTNSTDALVLNLSTTASVGGTIGVVQSA